MIFDSLSKNASSAAAVIDGKKTGPPQGDESGALSFWLLLLLALKEKVTRQLAKPAPPDQLRKLKRKFVGKHKAHNALIDGFIKGAR